MATADSVFASSTGRLMDRYGEACTIRRPHTLKRFDGTLVTALQFKTLGAEDATSITLELSDSARLAGALPVGLVLTIAAAEYTLDALAIADASANAITVSITPGLAAEAAIGAAITVPRAVTWAGTSTAAPRYFESSVGAFDQSGLPIGTRVATVERWSSTVELLAGATNGDYLLDASGNSLGRFTQMIDSTPDGFDGVVQ